MAGMGPAIFSESRNFTPRCRCFVLFGIGGECDGEAREVFLRIGAKCEQTRYRRSKDAFFVYRRDPQFDGDAFVVEVREHAGMERPLPEDYVFEQVFVEIVHGCLGDYLCIVGGLRFVLKQPVYLVGTELVVSVERAYEGPAVHSLGGYVARFVARRYLFN